MSNMHPFLSRRRHYPIPHRVAVMLAAPVMLAWASSAFCGEIHDAAASCEVIRVQALLEENPALINSKDKNGATPLHWAAAWCTRDMAELLLAHKADVNAKANDGTTPLHGAAANGRKDVAELLLANGAEVNAKADEGQTPLHLAVLSGHKHVVELLRQHGGHE